MVKGWSEGYKREFIEDLINDYIANLNFELFITIFMKLEIAAGKSPEEVIEL